MQAKRGVWGHRKGDLWKGLAAGAVGGLAASVVMNRFQALWSKLAQGRERAHGAQSMQQGSPQTGVGRELQEQGSDEEQDDAAMRLASAISVGVFNHELTQSEKSEAGTVIHYAFGITTGGVYGAAAEFFPNITAGTGLPFGSFVWLTADEGVVPALGLSKSPSQYPFSIHAYALASHLVYGLTAEMVRRVVRQAL
jgi:putative membrane protein